MRNQRVGTAIIARGKMVHACYGCEADPLGRWTTMTFRGRGGHNLHTISAYRPQANKNPYGVYQQLLQHNTDQGIQEDPIHTYDKQLSSYLSSLIQKGDQVILMVDANENITRNNTGFSNNMEAIGLYEAILSRHASLAPPPTRTPGRTPIDAIYCTSSIVVRKSGYAPFNGFTDHRLAWIDVA